MKKGKEQVTMGTKNIKWGKYKGEMTMEYKDMVRRTSNDLDAED